MTNSTPYSAIVLDHYQNPRNVGVIEQADAVGVAENSACGDVLHLYLKVDDQRVTRATFRTFGCVAAIAAGSRLTEMIVGADLARVRQIRRQEVVEALGGLPPLKVHCSVLAEAAVRAALNDLERRRGKPAGEQDRR